MVYLVILIVLRSILLIRWQKAISNEELCRIAECEDRNMEIKSRKFICLYNSEISSSVLTDNPAGKRIRG